MSDFSHLSAFVNPSGVARVQAIIANEPRLVLPVSASGDITFGTLETLSPPSDGVTVSFSTTPVQVAGDEYARGAILSNETFSSGDTGWTHDGTWVLTTVATASASSTTLSQASKLRVGETYLVVYKITNTLGTILASLGSTNLTSRGSGGVTNKVYAEVGECAGSTTFALTPTGYTGTVQWAYVFPLTPPFEVNQLTPRAFSRIAAVVTAGTTIANLETSAQHGLWPGYLRVS